MSCTEQTQHLEHQSDIQVIIVKMEILLEPTSNKLMVGDLCDSIRIKLVTTRKKCMVDDSYEFKLVPSDELTVVRQLYTSAGNPVKEILLKLNPPDHRAILTDSKDT
ncbi:hypothetical protein Tco_0103441 [Tanacetum coccineum]